MGQKGIEGREGGVCTPPDEWVSMQWCAEYAGVTYRTVHTWASLGYFRSVRPVRRGSARRRVDKASFVRWFTEAR